MEPDHPQPDEGPHSSDQQFQQLRELLLGEEFRQLLHLRGQFDDDEQFSARVSQVLAEAIAQRGEADHAIADALAPTIDDALSGSVANDPERLANSIYPIMGPAIRKSIGEAINDLLEDLNRLLTMGLSWEALGWRFEAWRTGRSYSEVALLKSLEYRVEQVFLIHRNSGLLIHHVQGDDDQESRDPDMVSGMLSAIQSFIQDSFSVGDGETLDTMRLGDLTVLVRQGPAATLAVVVRGHVPGKLRDEAQTVLERLHGRSLRALRDFDGDAQPLGLLRPDLETLVHTKLKDKKARTPWLALLVILLLLLAAGYWWYQGFRHDQGLAATAEQLNAEPGIVWLSTESVDKNDVFSLLVDPDARQPQVVLAEKPPATQDYQLRQQAHLSADPEIVLRRAERILQAPTAVALSWSDGGLLVTGQAEIQWVERAQALWPAIPGLQNADFTRLQVSYPQREAIERLETEVQEARLEFDVASTEIGAYTDLIPELAVKIRELNRLYLAENRPQLRIDIVGYTDETGTRDTNHRIGTERAETVRLALLEQGLPARWLNASDSLDYHNVDSSRQRQVRLFIQSVDRPAGPSPESANEPLPE